MHRQPAAMILPWNAAIRKKVRGNVEGVELETGNDLGEKLRETIATAVFGE